MPDEKKFEIHARQRGYSGFLALDIFKVSHDAYRGGRVGPLTREVLVRGEAVAVLPYDARRDRVVLTEQFRMPAAVSPRSDGWVIEPIAGLVEDGEAAEDVARREAVEEAGLALDRLEPIHGYFPTPGACSEYISIYAAPIDAAEVQGIFGREDEGEDIRVLYPTADEAFEMMAAGRLNSALGLIAIQWLRLNRARLRRDWTT